MNRSLWIASLACLLVASTGCRTGNMGGCPDGSCGQTCSECEECSPCGGAPAGIFGMHKGCGYCGTGWLARLCGKGHHGSCGNGQCSHNQCGPGTGNCGTGCRTGCAPGPLGWQQGGHDYSSHLQPGLLSHRAPAALNNQPFTPGPPSAQVAYPYYSHRGPRDFLMADPPTIGR